MVFLDQVRKGWTEGMQKAVHNHLLRRSFECTDMKQIVQCDGSQLKSDLRLMTRPAVDSNSNLDNCLVFTLYLQNPDESQRFAD